MRLRWWLFWGQAHEIERHRYRRPFERALLAVRSEFDQVALAIGAALMPPVRRAAEAIADLGQAWTVTAREQ